MTSQPMPSHLRERYDAALHRTQSAIAFKMTKELPHLSADPANLQRVLKHIRVGVDSAFSTQKALTDLLIAKGIFTFDEYYEAITNDMEREADFQVETVQRDYGLDGVNFG